MTRPAAPPHPAAPPRLLLAVGLVVAAWSALAIPVPAARGGHVSGDEPHYLLTALSLAEDGDLDIADELDARRWRAFHRNQLYEQTVELAGGRRVSPHDPLLPALLAAPVALGGWVAAKASLAVLAGALAALLVWTAVHRLGVAPGPAATVVGAYALGPPLAVYGTQVYPELPAALAVTAALAALLGPLRRRGTAVAAAAVVALPWLSVKYVPVAAVLAGLALLRLARSGRGRQAAALAAVLAVAGAVHVGAHLAWYGGLTPYATGAHFAEGELTVVGSSPQWAGRARRVVGLLVDRHFGLLAWHPGWALAVPAVAALAARRARPAPPLLAPLAVGWLTATFVALTMHGWWWPGRQVVVVLPAAVLAMAWWVGHVAPRALAAAVAAGAVGAATYLWAVVEGLVGRATWIVDFAATANPWPRLWRLVAPHGQRGAVLDDALLATWAVALLAVAVAALRRAGRRPAPPG